MGVEGSDGMEWLDLLNDSLHYVEDQLTGDFLVEEAARIAHCSSYHYQRMFSYIAGVTLGEYIRRRKMSLAGVELQKGAKVMDVALHYGYESPTSFNRVFKTIHGITPQEAKQPGAKLTSYPMLTFSITVKGVEAMEYQLTDMNSFQVLGTGILLDKDMEKSQQLIPKFWNKVSEEGALMQLIPHMNQQIPGVFGISMMTSMEQSEWEYVIGVASEETAEGFTTYQLPAAKWAIFSGTGSMPHAIQELQKKIYTEWLPTSGFEYAELPDIEVYLNTDTEDAQFQVWFPVRPK